MRQKTAKRHNPKDSIIFEDGTMGFTELVSSNEKSISKKGLYFIDLFDNDVTLDAILMFFKETQPLNTGLYMSPISEQLIAL